MVVINNKKYHEYDIVMSPTDVTDRYNYTQDLIVKCIKSWSPIGENDIKENTLSISKNHSQGVLNYYQPQHLHILSNEQIKVDDWCIMLDDVGNVFSTPQQYINPETQHLNKGLRKIIATTDTSLKSKIKYDTHISIKSIAQIPQSFIAYFISEYNKGNIINKIFLEVEEIDFVYKIKINKYNEINILNNNELVEDFR